MTGSVGTATVRAADTSVPVTMPQLGETVAEGTVTRWLKQVGDLVVLDEPLLEVSTDKVDTEVAAPATGILTEIVVLEDQTVSVGAVVARIGVSVLAGSPQRSADPALAPPETAPAGVSSRFASTQVLREDAARPGPGARHRLSPRRRRLASTQSPLSPLPPPDSAAPVGAPPPTAVPVAAPQTAPVAVLASGDRSEPMTRMRRVIADRMLTSLQTTAQLTTVTEVDVSEVAAILAVAKAARGDGTGTRLTYSAFFARAALDALRRHPVINASISPDAATVHFHGAQHLGVAVDTDRGLLVPVIRDAGDLNVSGLARRIAEVASRARSGQLTADELNGGTFTITNTGSRGALFDTPILNAPQVAILGTGAVVERTKVVRDDTGQPVIAIRSMVYLALSYDHRLLDGADAARFLSTVRELLESPGRESYAWQRPSDQVSAVALRK